MGSRFSCTVLMCLVMCSCTEPIPIEDPDTRGTELEDDSTSNVNTNLNWEGWNDPVTIGLASGDEVADFATWTVRYDMWCKMHFFGEAIELQEGADLCVKRRGPQNLLDLLPMVFIREEAGLMRQRQNIHRGNVKMMLDNWKKRGYIEPYGEKPDDISRQQYIKTEAYIKLHPQTKRAVR